MAVYTLCFFAVGFTTTGSFSLFFSFSFSAVSFSLSVLSFLLAGDIGLLLLLLIFDLNADAGEVENVEFDEPLPINIHTETFTYHKNVKNIKQNCMLQERTRAEIGQIDSDESKTHWTSLPISLSYTIIAAAAVSRGGTK